MEIKFDFDMDDWMEFQKLYIQNSHQHKRARLISTLIVPGFFIVFLTSYYTNGGSGILLPINFGLISIAWILFYPKHMLNRTMDNARKILENGDNSGTLGIHNLVFSDEGILNQNRNKNLSGLELRKLKKP
ncbi:hypothetical protein [Reichenbachiella sp.]|uniref:hypothetical protein n=1 Tax=Reichenbachiella sp. TaxID=2184521 RepID=UPI003BB05269